MSTIGSITDAQTQYNNATANVATQNALLTSMTQALQGMLAQGGFWNIQEAFNYGSLSVSTQALNTIGSAIEEMATQQNICTAFLNGVSSLENIFNEGSSITQTDANTFASTFNDMYNNLNNGGTAPPWMNSSNWSTAISTMDSMYSTMGANPGQLTGTQFFNDMQSWFPANPTDVPAPQIASMESDFQTLNNVFSAQSQTNQTELRSLATLYQQLAGTIYSNLENQTTAMNAVENNMKVS